MAGLLEKLGLQNRLLSEQNPDASRATDINWTDVETRLEVQRKHSISFLESALRG
jgi:hypothetical protein